MCSPFRFRLKTIVLGSTIQVQWGAFEQNSGGIVMEGQLYEPKARVFVDAERRAHIEFEPLFPWGVDDVKTTKWELWGPLAGDEKFVKDEDLIMETSTGRIRIDRSIPGNNTILGLVRNGSLNAR